MERQAVGRDLVVGRDLAGRGWVGAKVPLEWVDQQMQGVRGERQGLGGWR